MVTARRHDRYAPLSLSSPFGHVDLVRPGVIPTAGDWHAVPAAAGFGAPLGWGADPDAVAPPAPPLPRRKEAGSVRPRQTHDPASPPPEQPAAADGGGGIWAPQRRALTLGLVTTITLVAFEALAVITILPVVSADLHGLRLYGWVTSAFFLATLLATVVAGERADRHGPAPVFVTAIALFVAGLAIGGLAPSMPVLVLGRALQGLGAGAIPAVIYASVGRTYPEALRPRLFAVTSSAWVIPGIIGPAVSALVASRFGWRAVFLGLLPLVLVAASLTVPALRHVGVPPRQPDAGGGPGRPARRALLADAALVSAGTGLVLAGLTERNLLIGAVLVVAGLALGVRPLLRILPAGTLRARRGLPVAVLERGLLTFTFFGADTYVPLAITSARGRSTALASLAVTAATLAWTCAAWVQERRATVTSGRRMVSTGMLVLIAGLACSIVALHPAVPVALAVVGWGVAGFGIGLAYSPISVLVLRHAPPGQEGWATGSMQLADNLGVALGAGLGGALVAGGAAAGWRPGAGIAAAFALAAVVGVGAALVARRLPGQPLTGGESPRPDTPAGQPGGQDAALGWRRDPPDGPAQAGD
jgi:MFS family permease